MSLRYLDSDEPLRRFIQIKSEITQLQSELDELKPLITAALWEEPDNATIFLSHEIKLATRRFYEYSEAVENLSNKLKSLKKQEEHNGPAVIVKQISFPVCKAIEKE